MYITVTVDPATGKSGRDKTAIMAVGTHKPTGRVYILQYTYAHIGALSTVTHTLDYAETFDCDEIGFEAVQYQATLEELMRKEMRRRKKRYRIIPLHRNQYNSKSMRIQALSGFLENNDVFLREGMTDLVREFDEYGPTGALGGRDHLLDTLADHITLSGKRSNIKGAIKSNSLTELDEAPGNIEVSISCIPSLEGKESVIIALGKKQDKYYVLWAEILKLSINEIEDRLQVLLDKYKDNIVGCVVESKAYNRIFDKSRFAGIKFLPMGLKKDNTRTVAAIDRGKIVFGPESGDLAEVLLEENKSLGLIGLTMAYKLLHNPEGVKVWKP